MCQSVINILRGCHCFISEAQFPLFVTRDAWEPGPPFLYRFYYIINLFLSLPVINILTKLNLIFLVSLMWKSFHDTAVVTLCLDQFLLVMYPFWETVDTPNIWIRHLDIACHSHVFFVCCFDCDYVVGRHHYWAAQIISFLSFKETKTILHGP